MWKWNKIIHIALGFTRSQYILIESGIALRKQGWGDLINKRCEEVEKFVTRV